jgi:hypothetical protein
MKLLHLVFFFFFFCHVFGEVIDVVLLLLICNFYMYLNNIVDYHTDAIIQRVIRETFKDSTVITIAHRLSSVCDSDFVMVMENGKLIEMGKPHVCFFFFFFFFFFIFLIIYLTFKLKKN